MGVVLKDHRSVAWMTSVLVSSFFSDAREIEMYRDALERAQRLLEMCVFDAQEDLEDYKIVMAIETERTEP